jgi:hypothetical protein
MELERAMRLAAVQVDGHGGDRHVRECERDQDETPPGEIEEAGKHHRMGLPLRKMRSAPAILREPFNSL